MAIRSDMMYASLSYLDELQLEEFLHVIVSDHSENRRDDVH